MATQAVSPPSVVGEPLRPSEEMLAAREAQRTAWGLILASSTYFFGMMLGVQAEQEVWRRVFKGDAGRNATTQARIQALSGAISFAIQPLIAAHTDAFGRKPSMLLSQVVAFFRCLSVVISPGLSSMIAGDLARSLTFNTWYIALQASLGDLFKAEPQEYAKFSAYFQMVGPLMMAISPIPGARLAQRDLRLPFLVGAGLSAANVGVAVACLPETCRPSARVPFSIRQGNPLTFMKLLTSGARLRRLALCEVLGGMTDGRATSGIAMVELQQRFQWTLAEKGKFQSIVAALLVPSFTYIAPLMQALGARWSMILGTGSVVLQNLLNGLARNMWHAYATLILTSPCRMMSMLALKAPTMQAGTEIGMAQGELQGAISNIQTLCRIIAPLLWSNVFAWGNARGRPSLFYYGVASGAVLQLLLAASGDLEARAPKEIHKSPGDK